MSRRRTRRDRPPPRTTTPVGAHAVAVLDATTTLRQLAGVVDDLTALTLPSNARTVFASLRTKAQQETEAELLRIERAAHITNRIKGLPAPSGRVPVPLRLAPVDAIAAVDPELQTLTSVVLARITETRHVCPVRLPRSTHAAGVARYLASVMILLDPDDPTVTRSGEVAARVLAKARRARDGEPSKRLEGQACPWCGQETLVAYFDREIIRCDHEPGDKCVCATEDCGCRYGRRHEWARADGGWDILARLLTSPGGTDRRTA